MTEHLNRGSARPRPALVIDGEAVLIARHARAKPVDGEAWAEAPAGAVPPASSGRARPQPARQRVPPAPDLLFQGEPRQRFAASAERPRSVLPRSVWIAGLVTLAALVPLAAVSVYTGSKRGAPEVTALSQPSGSSWSPAPTVAAAKQADKPVQILYGSPAVAPTRLAFSGDTHPAPLPGTLGGVYPVAAGLHPAGVARLGSVQNVRDLKNAARRTPAE